MDAGRSQLPAGLGWFVQSYNGIPVVWQFGVVKNAYSSLILKLPNRGLTLSCSRTATASPAARAREGGRHGVGIRADLPACVRPLMRAGRLRSRRGELRGAHPPPRRVRDADAGDEARADLLITPFVGTTFGGRTTLLDLDIGAARRSTGCSAPAPRWLSTRSWRRGRVRAPRRGSSRRTRRDEPGDRKPGDDPVRQRHRRDSAERHPRFSPTVSDRRARTGSRRTSDDLIGLVESARLARAAAGRRARSASSPTARRLRFDLRHFRTLEPATTLLGERT